MDKSVMLASTRLQAWSEKTHLFRKKLEGALHGKNHSYEPVDKYSGVVQIDYLSIAERGDVRASHSTWAQIRRLL
jgi:hypothetical protein